MAQENSTAIGLCPSASAHFPVLFTQALRSGNASRIDGLFPHLHSNISFGESQEIYNFIRRTKPQRTLETGFALGISTLAICQGLEDNGAGIHTVIDPFQEHYSNNGLKNITAAGLGHRFRFFRDFPERVLPSHPCCDFVFIDSSHLFDLTIAEFVLCDKILNSGGTIGFHDLWMPAIQKVVHFILRNRTYKLLPPFMKPSLSMPARIRQLISRLGGDRIGKLPNLVLLKKLGNDSRNWQFFEDF